VRWIGTAGRRATPLFGVPMTVKEASTSPQADHLGLCGTSRQCRAEDALVVQRLTAAGAVVFGKTNVPVASPTGRATNPVYGATSNRDLAHTPGGSSARAAAIAAGYSALEIGTTSAARSVCPRITAAFLATSRAGDCAPARPVAGADRRADRHRGDRPAGSLGADCRWRWM